MTLSDYPNRKELERMKTNNDDHKKPAKENLSVIEKYKMTLKRLYGFWRIYFKLKYIWKKNIPQVKRKFS